MKSTHEPFDDELRERLRHYTEEPDSDLWQGIAPRIVSVHPEPGWAVWSQRASAVVIAGAAIMVAVFQSGLEKAAENKSMATLRQQEQNHNATVDKKDRTLLKHIEHRDIGKGQNESGDTNQEPALDLSPTKKLSEHNNAVIFNPGLITERGKEIKEPVSSQTEIMPNGSDDYIVNNDTARINSLKTNELENLKIMTARAQEISKPLSSQPENFRERRSDDYIVDSDTVRINSLKTGESENLKIGIAGAKQISKPDSSQPDENFLQERSDNYVKGSDTVRIISPKKGESDTLTKAKQQSKNNRRKNQRHRSYTIYFTAMPTFGYQRVESNLTDNIIVESIDRLPAFSAKRLGVRAELGIEFPVSKKIRVFGGLLYYQRKQTIGYTEKHLDSTILMSGPNGDVIIEPEFSYLKKSVEYELKNIGVQVGFNYKLSKDKPSGFSAKSGLSSKTIPIPRKKFLHLVGTGIEFHKALNKTNEFNKANGFTNPSAYVFFNIYYRLQYPSEGRLRAVFQPTLNYSFYINENLSAPFYVKPYGFGLNFGCTYNF